ncbi:MAG: hypothetical protein Q4E01_03590 [Actinomycetaceae bacterium]|nr:hypothetical protein [Actinomycetaceae bacterium]
MESTVQSRVLQLLSGVDSTYSKEEPRIAWIQTQNPSDLDAADYTVVFSANPTGERNIQLLGDFGTEGDEAVFSDGLIVETCSLSGLPYMDILGPTYVSFETEDDALFLRELVQGFEEAGEIPSYLMHRAVVFELAGFAPEKFDVTRSIVTEDGEAPWPIPPAIRMVRDEFPTVALQFAHAILMAQRMGSDELVFDLPNMEVGDLEDLLLARTGSQYRCMNTKTGRIYSLGYDMYRAVLSIFNPERSELLPGEEMSDETREAAIASLREIVQL